MDSLHNSTVVAGYRIDGALGEGGMGTVYRATQLSLDRVVALKVLTAELSSDPAFRERFRREGLVQAALEHPHIVTVFEAGQADQGLFLAMQMVEGPTLKDLVRRHELGDRRALRLLTQVAEALDAAHSKGLIHRDVKPQNVLVGKGEHAYLADFGLTRASDDARMTATGLFVGTIDYISPEQARGESATASSDVYALTAVLYECLTRQVPFVRATEERVLLAHLTEDPPRITELRSDLPDALEQVIARGMAKDPADRPASARELMLDARRALGALPASDAGATPTRIASAPAPSAQADPSADTSKTRYATETASPPGGAPLAAPRAEVPATERRRSDAPAAPAARHRAPFILAVAVTALLAGVLGVLLGGSGTSSHAAFGDSASTGNIELSFPSSWHRIAAPAPIAALPLADTIALAPTTGATSAALLAGVVNTSGPALLPAALLAGRPLTPSAVEIGASAAYRYSNVSVPGLAGPATIYAIPTTAGVATVACLAGSSGVQHECAQIAATLRLNSASAFPLTPSPAYAGALTRALGSLQATITAASARLAGAHSAGAQAAAADQLASAFRTAGLFVAHLSVSPAVSAINAKLAGALSAAGNGYAALAGAARAEDEGAYARAARAVDGAQTEVSASLAGLAAAGYSVGG
jgi:serine/threonine-protein kinase